MKYNLKPFLLALLIGLQFSCKKDKDLATIVTNNDIPSYEGVATVLVENYVNRSFIDLIGREPLDIEMSEEVATLEASNLSETARINFIQELLTDASYRPGDSSYQFAYYNRFKDLVMARMLEGASESVVDEFIGPHQQAANIALLNGDITTYNIEMAIVQKLEKLKTIGIDFKDGNISVEEIFRRTLDNPIYDAINMNSFNFINASFNDLYLRFPTQEEFSNSYVMVENSVQSSIFGETGGNKQEYMNIIIGTDEFFEGIIHWTYNTLLARNASAAEVFKLLPQFIADQNLQSIQLEIMKSDEYANF